MPVQLSHYRLLERLGAGGMGEVWLAEDLALPRRVAIKLLSGGAEADAAAIARALHEARAAASIDHPNVVAVYEAGVESGRPFLVMPYLEGETLEQRIARGPVPVQDAVAWARAIADALAEVHALGIVHRDLKPANVILTARGPRVLDFGVAAMADGPALTQTGMTVGTPLAMSPEQFAGRPADARSDLWSLGVLLYAALTGEQPFAAASPAAVMTRVLHDEPPAPSVRSAAVGREAPGVDRIVGKLLRKDPAARYARAEDVVADLAAVLAPTGPVPTALAPRLAVIDFEVIGADPEDQFLAAGLSEDLVVDLARVPGLHVSARGETQPFKGRGLPARTLARELGVEYVVQGSVRRAGARGRISAQLVRASDGHAVWAERFDRTLDDLFDVQAEVSKAIVDALQIQLRPADSELLTRPPTRNSAAYAHYLRGLEHGTELRRAASARAEESFRAALALDPDFALAHAHLARTLLGRAQMWPVGPEAMAEARTHAERAIALDPGLPEGHLALATVLRRAGDAEGALAQATAARLLDSTDPTSILTLGSTYLALGRTEEAFAVLDRAVRQHPRDYRLISLYADCANLLGRQDIVDAMLVRAREVLVEWLDRKPDDAGARAFLSIALAQAGDPVAGVEQAERALLDADGAAGVLHSLACTFTYAGDPDRAIALLEQAVALNPGYNRDWLARDPDLAPLRELPAFRALVEPPGPVV